MDRPRNSYGYTIWGETGGLTPLISLEQLWMLLGPEAQVAWDRDGLDEITRDFDSCTIYHNKGMFGPAKEDPSFADRLDAWYLYLDYKINPFIYDASYEAKFNTYARARYLTAVKRWQINQNWPLRH